MRKIFAGLLLFPLAACSAEFDSFRPVKEEERDAFLEAHFRAIDEDRPDMPSKYVFQYAIQTGLEEDRNPLFGEVIYKQLLDKTSLKFTYDAAGYKATTETWVESYPVKTPTSSSQSVTSFAEDTSEGEPKEEDKGSVIYSKEVVYVKQSSVFTSYELYENGKKVDESEYEDAFKDAEEAKSSFNKFTVDDVMPLFDTLCDMFYQLYESIPLGYDEAYKDYMTYSVHSRMKFAGDVKINLIKYADEEKKTCTEYYYGVTKDLLPYSYRGFIRGYNDYGPTVTETNITLS